MARRRKKTKMTEKEKKDFRAKGNVKYVNCKKCGITEMRTNRDTVAATCSLCVAMMVADPQLPKHLQRTGRPPGWHFRNYFEDDGKVYHRGKEVKSDKKIEELRKKYKKKGSGKKSKPSK